MEEPGVIEILRIMRKMNSPLIKYPIIQTGAALVDLKIKRLRNGYIAIYNPERDVIRLNESTCLNLSYRKLMSANGWEAQQIKEARTYVPAKSLPFDRAGLGWQPCILGAISSPGTR